MTTPPTSPPLSKPCRKCGKVKSLDSFRPHHKAIDGLRNKCNACYAVEDAEARAKELVDNPQLSREKPCRKCGAIKPLVDFHPHSRMSDGRLHTCKDCHRIYLAGRREANPDYMKAWHAANKDHSTQYYEDNKQRYLDYHANYVTNRRNADPRYKLQGNLRTRLRSALKDRRKRSSVFKLIGCSLDELMAHLEAQFTEGMTWGNYGKWHVDHIKPLAIFDDPEDLTVWHYENLQPLWAEDNYRKGATLISEAKSIGT